MEGRNGFMAPVMAGLAAFALMAGCRAAQMNEAPAPKAEAATAVLPMKVEWQEEKPPGAAVETGKLHVGQRVENPPQVDGRLDDACWQTAPTLTGFVMLNAPATRAAVQTQAKFVFTKDTLYAAFTCEEPKMDLLVAACKTHDGNVWYDDCAELWLGPSYDRHHSYHFLVNPLGTVYDARERDEEVDDPLAIQAGAKKIIHKDDIKWDSGCVARAAKGKGSWTAEVAIPVKAMGVDEIVRGSLWGLNVARTRRSGGTCDLSSWTGVFVTPISAFGTLQLGTSDCDVRVLSLGNLSQGDNVVRVIVRNRSGEAKHVEMESVTTSGEASRARAEVALAAGGEKVVLLPYTLDGPGTSYTLALGAVETGTGEKLFSRTYQGKVPEPLKFTSSASELYLGEQKEIRARLSVNLGDADLPKTSLAMELLNEKNELLAATALPRVEQPNAIVIVNIAEIKEEGDYSLRAKVMDGKMRCLAQKEVRFHLMESPF